jgi:hypothetical protein
MTVGAAAFIVVSGDIVTDYDYGALRERARALGQALDRQQRI